MAKMDESAMAAEGLERRRQVGGRAGQKTLAKIDETCMIKPLKSKCIGIYMLATGESFTAG